LQREGKTSNWFTKYRPQPGRSCRLSTKRRSLVDYENPKPKEVQIQSKKLQASEGKAHEQNQKPLSNATCTRPTRLHASILLQRQATCKQAHLVQASSETWS
jgi:hypothetical protein